MRTPSRKRSSCTGCGLVEPAPGTWVNDLCPRCAPKPRKTCPKLAGPLNVRFRDLTGGIFGRLTAVRYVGGSKWECLCQCGVGVTTEGFCLTRGITRSCGCLKREALRKNLTGQTFARLTVTSLAFVRRNCYWNCQCVCGAASVVSTNCLTTGKVRSCGCLARDKPNTLRQAAGAKAVRIRRRNALERGMPMKRPRGEQNGSSKLTADAVRAMRYEYAKGRISQRQLARQYGVSQANTARIVNYDSWKHVP